MRSTVCRTDVEERRGAARASPVAEFDGMELRRFGRRRDDHV